MTVDDAQAERLVGQAAAAARLTSTTRTDIQSLYTQALDRRAEEDGERDARYTALAPTLVALSQQASSSKQLLGSLESFLSTFQSDLSTLSTHISALQATSHQIDSQLDATRDVELQLAAFLSDIALSPRIVDLFFDTDPESRPELWLKAVGQLERVLDATLPSATIELPGRKEPLVLGDVQAVREVRDVAEACKNVVAAKLRTYLTAPHAAIKASVTTNLQVVQTSVLLRQHRPLYGFLARQMPRVAIDVQRSYVGAARLYFETAFRRYTRSLGVIRKRWVETSTAATITEPPPAGADASANARAMSNALQASMSGVSKPAAVGMRAGGSTPTRGASQDSSAGDADAMSVDAWLFSASRLAYSRLDSGAATVLGYLADDSAFKACPENLFRSLSLVLVDNVCSEYTFIVRFFEAISSDDDRLLDPRPAGETPGVASVDSASAVEEDEVEASVVQLSRHEQAQLRGRGASEEVFRQIMEPAVTTWTTFVKSLLPSSSLTVSAYFALLSMVQLNDALLALVSSRGCDNSLVTSAMMGFKLDSYPHLKRFLDDQIAALTNPSQSASLWKTISMSTTSTADPQIIAVRYTSLFTKSLWILQNDDPAILSALQRLRAQLAQSLPTTPPLRDQAINILISSLESALPPSLASHPTAQNEFAFWNNILRP
ncbi:vacuolar sorting protein VPS52 [Moesziomyces antarcticus T-34]|uniref:Vacuolar sorting protein VPS52 n=1 Tax=Pseudozyma antarctica (strain T-34) TaxID=1151754 RepID=M9LZL7_PSEA3|nr:vacuolar sorting protein VPS52 [Moesziomyces antarcticus T-34]